MIGLDGICAVEVLDGPVLQAELDPDGLVAPALRLAEAMRIRDADGGLALPARYAVFAPTTYEADIVTTEWEAGNGYLAGLPAVPPGGVVLDIGAHIGLFSLSVLRGVPSARVVAVEPFASSYRALRRNLAMTGGAAVAVQSAIADTAGMAAIRGCRGAAMVASIDPAARADVDDTRDVLTARLPRLLGRGSWGPRLGDWAAQRAVATLFTPVTAEVPVLTVSDLLRQKGIERVALMKVDVEGSECAVLDGIAPTDWPRIDAIVAEVSVRTLDPFVARLRRQGLDPQVHPLTAMSERFGQNMFMVRALRGAPRRPAAVAAPTDAPAANPLSDIYDSLQRRCVQQWPGRPAIIDLSLRGAPLALPWRQHGPAVSFRHGESWARYLVDRYAQTSAPHRLTAVFGGDWSDLPPNAHPLACVAAAMAADQVIDRLIRAGQGHGAQLRTTAG